MAIEDVACLRELIKGIVSAEEVPQALSIYEAVRAPRTRIIKAQALQNVGLRHLPDGIEQERRDEAGRREIVHGRVQESPYIWSNPEGMQRLFQYDLGQLLTEMASRTNEQI